MNAPRIITYVLPCLLCAGGCSVYDVPDRSRPPVAIPAAFSASGRASGSARWWKDFGDPALDALVERALADNLDLRVAWARLRQAGALARQAGAGQWPSVDAEAGVSRSRTETAGVTARANLFSAGLAAAYEVDLWRRVRSTRRAAELDVLASRGDLETAAISVAATVGDVWYSLVEQREQRKLLDEQVKTSETLLELVERRFGQGQASALDVYQQRTQLANTRGQVHPVEARLAVLEHQLAVLLGRAPAGEMAPALGKLPGLPPLPKTGLPADLLHRRPDVRAAARRLAAADYQVAAAVADRLPAVRLTGGAGYSSTKFHKLPVRPAWSIGSALLMPVFDAGRRAAEVSRTKAQVDEALAAYERAILAALREVEDALIQELKQRAHLESVERQVKLASATLRQARLRYSHGLSDYLPVLTAVQALQRLERAEVAARRELVSFRIQLYRALGGSWPKELAPAGGADGEKR